MCARNWWCRPAAADPEVAWVASARPGKLEQVDEADRLAEGLGDSEWVAGTKTCVVVIITIITISTIITSIIVIVNIVIRQLCTGTRWPQ